MLIFPGRRRDGTTTPITQQGAPPSTGGRPRSSESSISLSQDQVHRRPSRRLSSDMSLGQAAMEQENRETTLAERSVEGELDVRVANGTDTQSDEDHMVDGNSSDSHASETVESISMEHTGPFGGSQEHALAPANNTMPTASTGRGVHGSITPQTQLEYPTLSDRLPTDRPEVTPAEPYQTDQLEQAYIHHRRQTPYNRWLRQGLHGPWMPGTRRNRRAIRKAIRNIQKLFP